MGDVDILGKLKELNIESKTLLKKIEGLSRSFSSCQELVISMNSISTRVKKAMELYNDILESSTGDIQRLTGEN